MKVARDFPYYLAISMIALGSAMEVSSLLGGVYAAMKLPWMLAILVLMIWSAALFVFRMKELLGFLVFLVLGLYISYTLGRNWIIYITFALFFSKGKSIDSVVRAIFRCVGTVFLVNVLFFLICYVMEPGMLFVKDENRYDMFCEHHPNGASRQFLFCSCMYIYLNFRKMDMWRWAGLAVAAAFFYFFTRSDAMILFVLVWVAWLLRERTLPVRIMRFFSRYGTVLVLLVSLSSILLISVPALQDIYKLVNTFSTGRVGLGVTGLRLYGLTWFGADTKIGVINDEMIFVDNAYIYMIIHQGAFFLVLLAFLFGAASKKLDYRGLVFVVFYLLYGMIENQIFDMIAYVPLIISMHALYPRDDKQELPRDENEKTALVHPVAECS